MHPIMMAEARTLPALEKIIRAIAEVAVASSALPAVDWTVDLYADERHRFTAYRSL